MKTFLMIKTLEKLMVAKNIFFENFCFQNSISQCIGNAVQFLNSKKNIVFGSFCFFFDLCKYRMSIKISNRRDSKTKIDKQFLFLKTTSKNISILETNTYLACFK
tara:strand:+ start:1076 stop:1390 length:315 start_codon:yes stop_codon:yes gene_type:complete